jgi:hypothetical protein
VFAGGLRTNHRVRVVKKRPSHSVDPVGVWLVGEGLQCRESQLRIGQARRDDVEIARISEQAHQPETHTLVTGVTGVTGKGPDGRAAALGIFFDKRLDLVDQ